MTYSKVSLASAVLLGACGDQVVLGFSSPIHSHVRRSHLLSGASAVSSTAPSSPSSSALYSSTTDDAFAAFADSLEEEPEPQTPWQSKVDDLLNPSISQSERQILLSELLQSNQDIQQSVMDALANRKIDPLLTPNAKKVQDGTRAVARQLANDILPQLSKQSPTSLFPPPASFEKVGGRLFSVLQSQLSQAAKDIQQDLQDPLTNIPQRLSQQSESLKKEITNIVSETPVDLQGPEYTVVSSTELYEIRDYAAYKVCSTATTEGDNYEDLATYGTAFQTLATYIFGANEGAEKLDMTTPVTTTSTGEMRFYLSSKAPQPLDPSDPSVKLPASQGSVKLEDIPAARLAVRKFTGFVTDGEVARQKEVLLQSLEQDGVELAVPHGATIPHLVFQYNPPYTLPVIRRNELAIPVMALSGSEEVSLVQEWNVEDEDDYLIDAEEEDVSPSD